jgi:hypothetical protein
VLLLTPMAVGVAARAAQATCKNLAAIKRAP